MSFVDIVRTAGNVQGTIGAVTNFVQSIASYFGVDVVGVFDNATFDQLFNTARPLKANINRPMKVMDHPVEDGSIITDFSIVLPVEIELSMILSGTEYAWTYAQIKQYFLSRTLVSVQTKADTFSNMLIAGMPHEESPEMFDVLPLALKLREVQMVTVQYQALPPQAVATPSDQSTVQRGAQQPQNSILFNASQYLKGIF